MPRMYEPPKVESVLTAEELAREIQYQRRYSRVVSARPY